MVFARIEQQVAPSFSGKVQHDTVRAAFACKLCKSVLAVDESSSIVADHLRSASRTTTQSATQHSLQTVVAVMAERNAVNAGAETPIMSDSAYTPARAPRWSLFRTVAKDPQFAVAVRWKCRSARCDGVRLLAGSTGRNPDAAGLSGVGGHKTSITMFERVTSVRGRSRKHIGGPCAMQ